MYKSRVLNNGVQQKELLLSWQDMLVQITNSQQCEHLNQDLVNIFSEYANKPGKLLRPQLMLLGYRAYNDIAKLPLKIINQALSLEWLHLGLLIQDDIMDRGQTRRGKKCLHLALKDYHHREKMNGDADRFGESAAILFSDICINFAEKLWVGQFSNNTKSLQLSLFNDMKNKIYWGQFLDLDLSTKKEIAPLEAIIKVMDDKTASYSVYYPLMLGAYFNKDLTERDVLWIKSFATNIGIAYQITDDLISTLGDSKITGKSNLSDIKEKKQTLLFYYAYINSNKAGKEILHQFYFENNKNIQPTSIIEIFKKSNANNKTISVAKNYYKKAIKELEDAPINQIVKKQLYDLAEFIIKRNH